MTAGATPAGGPRDGAADAPFSSVLAVCTMGKEDESVVRLAAALANHRGARLSVLGVSDQSGALSELARHGNVPKDDVRRWFQNAVSEETAAVAKRAGVPQAQVEARIGKPFLEIIREVSAGGHDLVVKAAKKVAGVGGYLFTSTDQHLVRKCPVPLWLSVPQGEDARGPVLAAVDPDDTLASEPAAQAALNERIIVLAKEIAAFRGVPLIVLTAWDAPGEGLANRWFTEEANVVSYVRSVESERRAALEDLLERAMERTPPALREQPVTAIVERGPAATVIPDYARARGAGVLVMGTIARTGLSGFLIGNTAEDVLNTVTCSVVTVKPEGFVTPVR